MKPKKAQSERNAETVDLVPEQKQPNPNTRASNEMTCTLTDTELNLAIRALEEHMALRIRKGLPCDEVNALIQKLQGQRNTPKVRPLF